MADNTTKFDILWSGKDDINKIRSYYQWQENNGLVFTFISKVKHIHFEIHWN